MNEIVLQEELERLQKERKPAAANPSFAEQFPQVLDRTIEEVNPEFG